MKKSCSDAEFIKLFETRGADETAKLLNILVRNVYKRRRNLEKALDREIKPPKSNSGNIHHTRRSSDYPKRLELKINDGVILVGSDAHYWPGDPTTAHRAFIRFCSKVKPSAVILNGDVFDGARASRHAPIGWASPPTIQEERDTVEARLDEIRFAAKEAPLLWTIGNHDLRFESILSQNVPQFEGVEGFRLCDHFPHWKLCVSVWVNEDVVIKHRFKGGIHATHTNTLMAGKTMVTGHLHSLKVTPFSDYRGVRWGVDTGTLADPYGDQFDYDEDNPKNHRSGFVILTLKNGTLLWPEIVAVYDESHVQFRGEIIKV